jgi:hypothetical protein
VKASGNALIGIESEQLGFFLEVDAQNQSGKRRRLPTFSRLPPPPAAPSVLFLTSL